MRSLATGAVTRHVIDSMRMVCMGCLSQMLIRHGDVKVVWHNYIMAMQKAGFSSNVGLYVASGLLTYGANDGELCLHPGNPSVSCSG